MTPVAAPPEHQVEDSDLRVAYLRECLRGLSKESRELIIEYYREEGRAKIEERKALAEKLGISLNALFSRAKRIRDRLEQCVTLIPAIAALLIVFGGTWFAIETSRLRARLGEAQRNVEAQQERAQTQARQITELEAQYNRLTEEHDRLQAQLQTMRKTETSPSHIAPVFLTLSVEAFRSSGAQGTQTLVIPRAAAGARLRLYLPENAFPAYRVTLLTAGGIEVFSKNGLRPRASKAGDFVIVDLPASRLTNRDNILALSGVGPTGEAEPIGKSMLKVRRR